MSSFTKIIDKCRKLNEEMRADIEVKTIKINSLNAQIKDIESSIATNDKFIANVSKLVE